MAGIGDTVPERAEAGGAEKRESWLGSTPNCGFDKVNPFVFLFIPEPTVKIETLLDQTAKIK